MNLRKKEWKNLKVIIENMKTTRKRAQGSI